MVDNDSAGPEEMAVVSDSGPDNMVQVDNQDQLCKINSPSGRSYPKGGYNALVMGSAPRESSEDEAVSSIEVEQSLKTPLGKRTTKQANGFKVPKKTMFKSKATKRLKTPTKVAPPPSHLSSPESVSVL